MKGIDPKWVVFLGIAVTIEQGVGQGTVSLTHVVPATWAPWVQGWCAFLALIGTAVMTGMSAYSSNAAGLLVSAPSIPQAVKSALAIFAVLLASMIFVMPAMAGSAAAVPLPTPKPAAMSTSRGQVITATQAQQNPLLLLQQFTRADLTAAIADANAQTPPDTAAATCYTAILALVNSNVANPLPTTPGVFEALQKARDAKAALANLQSPTGPLASLNNACAPIVLDAQNTLLGLGVAVGLVANPAGGAAALAGLPAAIATFLAIPKL